MADLWASPSLNDSRRVCGMIAVGLTGVLVLGAFGQDVKPPANPPIAADKAVVPPQKVDDEKLDKILTRLEERKITDLRSKVRWDVEDVVVDDKTSKFGTLFYLDREPVAQFKVGGCNRNDRLRG